MPAVFAAVLIIIREIVDYQKVCEDPLTENEFRIQHLSETFHKMDLSMFLCLI